MAEAYRQFLRTGGLAEQIRTALRDLDTRDLAGLAKRGRRIREAVLATPLPADLQQEILRAYAKLCREYGPEVLLHGRSVGEKIGAGPVRVVRSVEELQDFRPGEVLVADMTDPDWEPTMKMAAAIVTNRGDRTCHAAIVSREIGVPCVVGTEKATAMLRTGQPVTVRTSRRTRGTPWRLPVH
jgi:phosphoenolpyruvate synthase/pyruvate phosphate dikinase